MFEGIECTKHTLVIAGMSYPDVRHALIVAGWWPGRRVDISEDVDRLRKAGYVLHDQFVEFMEEFHELEIQPVLLAGPNFANDEPYWIHPSLGTRWTGAAQLLDELFDDQHNPVGRWLSFSSVFMGVDGTVRAYLDGLVWELGRTPLEAIEFAVRPTRPLVCVWSRPGRPPWPKKI
jgi:hypothetical protein